MNKKQLKWFELQEMIVKSKPTLDLPKDPHNPIRLFFYKISKHIGF